MFIEPDEYIILQEGDKYFSLDDLKCAEDAGIKTVLLQKCYKEDGKDGISRKIELALKTNLKILIQYYWEYKYQEIDFSDPEAAKVGDLYLYDLLRSFYDIRDRFQLIYSIPQGGEFLWDAVKTKDFPFSNDDIIRYIIDRQKILITQHGEIWLQFHNWLGHPENWNNKCLPLVYDALRKEFPDTPFYSLQYAHFAVSGITETDEWLQLIIKAYSNGFGIRFFVGSEYCEGLAKNTDKAIAQGAYGLVCAPIHAENPVKHDKMEEWMINSLKEANKKFNENY